MSSLWDYKSSAIKTVDRRLMARAMVHYHLNTDAHVHERINVLQRQQNIFQACTFNFLILGKQIFL